MSPRCGFGWRGNTIFYQHVTPDGAVKVPAGGILVEKSPSPKESPIGATFDKEGTFKSNRKKQPELFFTNSIRFDISPQTSMFEI